MEPILKAEDLKVSFLTYAGEVQAVRGVSREVQPRETIAIVGESGCGKAFICMPSTFTDHDGTVHSRIVPTFSGDIVTSPRSQSFW